MTSFREYGNRVGAFRMFDALDQYGVKATVALDAEIATDYPALVAACTSRGYDLIAHGLSGSRMITEQMDEPTERAYIEASLGAVARVTGHTPAGWLGVEHGESSRTVRLLAEQGVRYVCDWPNDEQPYRMDVPTGSMVSLPILAELDDINALQVRRWSHEMYTGMVTTAFDRLHQDGAKQGRLMLLELHPWVMGQPYRIPYLKRILEHCTRTPGVWVATAGEIVDWFEQHAPRA
jgi:peptidoglycan/xylan/chitin deacetylase (PgdA/CDA1 family)